MKKTERVLIALACLTIIYHFAVGPWLSDVAARMEQVKSLKRQQAARQDFIRALGNDPASQDKEYADRARREFYERFEEDYPQAKK